MDTNHEQVLTLGAVAVVAPTLITEQLCESVVALGGWVLRKDAVSSQCAEIDFEFPRSGCLEAYCLLAGAGLELTVDAHAQMSALWHCSSHLALHGNDTAVRIHLSLYAREGSEAFLGEKLRALPPAA